MRVRQIQIDAAIGMLCVVADVDVVGVIVDSQRRKNMVDVSGDGINYARCGPGFATVIGAHEQNIRVAAGITEKGARRIGPRQIESSVPGSESRLKGHAGCLDVPR